MNRNLWRIAADIPLDVRKYILQEHAPQYQDVFCKTVTHAYRVSGEFCFDESELTAYIYGYHAGPGHEALLVRMGPDIRRPDGRPYFIALSTLRGIQPAAAGDGIIETNVQQLPTAIEFCTRFQRFPLWKHEPTRQAVYA